MRLSSAASQSDSAFGLLANVLRERLKLFSKSTAKAAKQMSKAIQM
jgi:hypothetical protein